MSLAEAGKTQLTISVSLVVALVVGAYYAGLDAGKGHGRAEAFETQGQKTTKIETTLAEVSTILKHLAAGQEKQGTTITSLESRVAGQSADIQELRSHVIRK